MQLVSIIIKSPRKNFMTEVGFLIRFCLGNSVELAGRITAIRRKK